MFTVKFKHLIVATALGIAGLASTAEAASQRIDCPLTQARRTITNPLPSGWWTTPFVYRLSGVDIRPVGGKPTLICKYGYSGDIMRLVPRGQTCRKNGGGFICTTRSAGGPRPRTLHTGALTVPQTYTVDFDTGRVGGRGADIWFQAETATRMYLTPRGGARMSIHNRAQSLQSCKTARTTSGRVSLRDVRVGSYICVRTNEGRTAQFRINGISGGSPKRLSIGYTTWAN